MSPGENEEDPPPEPSRLDVVLDGLYNAAMGKVSLPVITSDDAIAVCGMFHLQAGYAIEARELRAGLRGHPLACEKGCNHCCNNAPAIFAGEAVTIARWLERPENKEVLAGFYGRYPGWFSRVEDLLRAWAAAATAGDAAGAEAALTEVWRRGVMCAFNEHGACTIYEVRPNVCRNVHALDTNEHCKPDSQTAPMTMPYPPLEEYMGKILPVVFAMHASLRNEDGTGSQPLCVAVHDELLSPSGIVPPAPAPAD